MKFKPLIASLLILLIPISAGASELAGILDELKDLVELSKRVKLVEDQLAEIPVDHFQDYNNRIEALREGMTTLAPRIESLENRPEPKPVVQPANNPYMFVLKDANGDGDVDEEWEEIIAKGQEIQKSFWEKSETEWMQKLGSSPSGKGWFGTAESPVITISCEDPVYYFHNTARLPGRFRIWCPVRWGTFLRFLGDGDKVMVDNNGWGTQTDAPIGIYVEPSIVLDDGRHVRNFEQTIQNVMIIAQNGVMPIYLAENPFNLQISDCNIQAHQGAKIVVKHGPLLIPKGWGYPVEQISTNVYLPDPKFINIQVEGRHKFERKGCGFLVSGNNIIFQNINFYGVMQGIYAMGQGIVVNGCTLHHGATADGRSWCPIDQFVLATLTRRDNQNANIISGCAGPGKEWNLIKWATVPSAGGWHNAGERSL